MHRKPFCFSGQVVHPPGQRFDGTKASAEILKGRVRKVLCCPVGRFSEWFKTKTIRFNRYRVPMVCDPFNRLAVVAYNLSNDRHKTSSYLNSKATIRIRIMNHAT